MPGSRDVSYYKRKMKSGMQDIYGAAPGARDFSMMKKNAKGGWFNMLDQAQGAGNKLKGMTDGLGDKF